MVRNILIGADPELFLEKNNEIISAEGLIGGTKLKPKKISKKGHAIQEDNVMVEFNIPACNIVEDFIENINFVKDYLTILANLHNCKLNYQASAILDKKWLQTPQAKLFGCESDFDVYERDINDPPCSLTSLRTCGGHIHIGYDNPSKEISEKIVFAMDITLGLDSINLDKDDRRRKMYGKAGCFRFKDYGVEYRSLSNFWITTDKLISWAFNKTLEATELVNSGIIDEILNKYKKQIQNVINNNDKNGATKLGKKIELIKEKKLIKI